jgi:hypothetical protein
MSGGSLQVVQLRFQQDLNLGGGEVVSVAFDLELRKISQISPREGVFGGGLSVCDDDLTKLQ